MVVSAAVMELSALEVGRSGGRAVAEVVVVRSGQELFVAQP